MTEKKYSDIKILRRIFSIARPYWLHLGAIFSLEFLGVLILLLLPFPVKIAVDSVIGSEPLPKFVQMITPESLTGVKTSLLWVAVSLQVVLALLMNVHNMSNQLLKTYTGEKLNLSFRKCLFSHIQRLSFSFHDSRGTADSIYRIQYDAPSIQYMTINGIIPLMSAILKLVGMIFVIAYINIQLALLAISITPVLYIFVDQFSRRMRPKYSEMKIVECNVLGIIHEVLTSFRVVKAFGREEKEHERFMYQSNEAVRKKLHVAFAEGIFNVVINVLITIGTAVIIFIGVNQVMAQTIMLGELLMVLTYLTQLYGPLQSISYQASYFQNNFASAQRALELLDETPDVVERSHARPLHKALGRIQYRDVCFAYRTDNLILKNISFAIEPGSLVGIRGKTGAGKTTLVSLLPRFYDVKSGEVFLDGVDVRDYKLQDLRNQFAIVLQEPVLFSTNIYENIAYARDSAIKEEIINAAKAANAHDFIRGLPDGYDTLVGEHGMKLSGGERQRISLARAFLKDAPILLLDEPTSSVDTKTETLIMDAMERLMKGRTTFMIAHRLSTLEKCDTVIEVENGRIFSIKPALSN